VGGNSPLGETGGREKAARDVTAIRRWPARTLPTNDYR